MCIEGVIQHILSLHGVLRGPGVDCECCLRLRVLGSWLQRDGCRQALPVVCCCTTLFHSITQPTIQHTNATQVHAVWEALLYLQSPLLEQHNSSGSGSGSVEQAAAAAAAAELVVGPLTELIAARLERGAAAPADRAAARKKMVQVGCECVKVQVLTCRVSVRVCFDTTCECRCVVVALCQGLTDSPDKLLAASSS